MTWDNLFNLLIHPWVGACSDRTWNRWGRRKPWIMMGVPIAALGFGLIPVALCVAGVGGALVLVNILPLVFDVGDERFIGAFTGLSGVPAQLAAVVGPSVAGLIVEAVGSQRVLFLVSVVALAVAGLFLARLKAPPGMERSSGGSTGARP